MAEKIIYSDLTVDGLVTSTERNTTLGDTEIGFAFSDETSDIEVGTAKVTFNMPFAMYLTDVIVSLSTAPVGSTFIVDLNEDGTSVLSTKVSVDSGEHSSATAATQPVISDNNIANNSLMTIDVDQVGSTTAGAGGIIILKGYKL